MPEPLYELLEDELDSLYDCWTAAVVSAAFCVVVVVVLGLYDVVVVLGAYEVVDGSR